jgi:hypothetical protein
MGGKVPQRLPISLREIDDPLAQNQATLSEAKLHGFLIAASIPAKLSGRRVTEARRLTPHAFKEV